MVDLKDRISSGQMIAGTFVKTPAIEMVEVLSMSGLDVLCLDAEHAPFDRARLDACLAVARGLGMPCLVRVPDGQPSTLLQVLDSGANGVVVINDAYNANPDSVVAALATLEESAGGRKIVVLGEMLELGAGAAAMHEEVGAAAAAIGPVLLCAVGEHAEDVRRGATEAGMSPERAIAATSNEIAAAEVERAWRRDDTVLVKGSRGSHMETVIETLRRSAAT